MQFKVYFIFTLFNLLILSTYTFSQPKIFTDKDSIGLVYSKIFAYFKSYIDTTNDPVFQFVKNKNPRNIYFRELDSSEIKTKKGIWTWPIYKSLLLKIYSDSNVINITTSNNLTNISQITKAFNCSDKCVSLIAYPAISDGERIYLVIMANVALPRDKPPLLSQYSFVLNKRLQLMSVAYKPIVL